MLSCDIPDIWFGFSLVVLRPFRQLVLLHDLISMTLMKGRGLLDVVDGLIGLLRGQEGEKLVVFFNTKTATNI